MLIFSVQRLLRRLEEMAPTQTFQELCQSAELKTDPTKLLTYCRSIPKMLDKAEVQLREKDEMGAFTLLWRGAHLAAEIQQMPLLNSSEVGCGLLLMASNWADVVCQAHVPLNPISRFLGQESFQ